MAYATTNARAAHNPLRSIPMFRPIAALGPASAAQHITSDHTRALAAQRLQQAQDEIGAAWEAYGDAKAAIGACNRLRAKSRHDRDIYSDRAVARRLTVRLLMTQNMRANVLPAHHEHRVVDPVPHAAALPAAQVVVDRLPERQIMRQQPLGRARLHEEQHGIDQFPRRRLSRPADRFRLRYQRGDQGPLPVAQVGVVGTSL